MNRQWQLAQWAEIRWWKRYLKNREPHAYLDWKLAYWESFLSATGLAIPSGARVLDAGCGPAGVFMSLPSCRVDAVDPLFSGYEALPHFQPGQYPWVRFFSQPLETFSGEGDYDLVFCINALNHMKDIPESAKILFRALKPGGSLVISVDVHKYGWIRRLFRAIPLDVLHPFQEDLAGYRKLFEGAGFREKSSYRYQKGRVFDYWVWNLQKQT